MGQAAHIGPTGADHHKFCPIVVKGFKLQTVYRNRPGWTLHFNTLARQAVQWCAVLFNCRVHRWDLIYLTNELFQDFFKG